MIQRPLLAPHARYRRDPLREQHQLVFPEGVLVLNDSAAEILRLCDGRTQAELLAELDRRIAPDDAVAPVNAGEVAEFLATLFRKGLVRDASCSTMCPGG